MSYKNQIGKQKHLSFVDMKFNREDSLNISCLMCHNTRIMSQGQIIICVLSLANPYKLVQF